MIVVQAPIFHVPGLAEAIKEEPKVQFSIGRGTEWRTKPVLMSESEALRLAAECRKRGLIAKVEAHG